MFLLIRLSYHQLHHASGQGLEDMEFGQRTLKGTPGSRPKPGNPPAHFQPCLSLYRWKHLQRVVSEAPSYNTTCLGESGQWW